MRDLLNLIQNLTEASTLSASVISDKPGRFDKFIDMIRTGIPFHDVNKEEIIADPDEADRFLAMNDDPDGSKFKGSLSLKTVDGDMIPLSKLLKTKELGGQASTGAEGEEVGKESALLKPSQIGITDKDIPANALGDAIINNEILQSTDYGRVVIGLARQIMAGDSPVIPNTVSSKVKKSIVDYAGEYLGVLALVQGTSAFENKEGFIDWLGGNLGDIILNFPSKANNNIADSFASIKNPNTEHQINISSKGTGGGAAPALSGLKISGDIRDNPKFKSAVDLIDLCQNKDLPIPGTISQVFLAMNLLHETNPASIPGKFNEFLPWTPSIVDDVNDSLAAFKANKDDSMDEYESLWNDIKFSKPASDGGKLTYAVKSAVMKAVNEGKAIANFQPAILAILDMNFIQQYADADKKGVMSFQTQWPAKLSGKVSLESKSSGGDPTGGGFSFKLANTPPKTELEMPDERPAAERARRAPERKLSDVATDITQPGYAEKEPSKGVGRKKRK